jgi:hypothetical protein
VKSAANGIIVTVGTAEKFVADVAEDSLNMASVYRSLLEC